MFPKIKVSEGNSWFNWSFHFSLGNRASRWPWKRYIYYWCVGQTSTRLGTRMGFFCRGRVWEAIIKGGKCFVRVQYRWGSLLCMKLILIFSSNSFFQFCILWIRKTSLFFSFLLEYLSFECFQFVHSLEKSSRGFGVSPWNVPGTWMRHKHSLRTLLEIPSTSGISSPPPAGGGIPICRSLGLFAFFAGPIATPMEERRMKTARMETRLAGGTP